MDSKKTGGPAFPQAGFYGGVTLRDYFAGKAIASAVTSCWRDVGYEPVNGLTDIEQHARFAYQIADAMIAERAK